MVNSLKLIAIFLTSIFRDFPKVFISAIALSVMVSISEGCGLLLIIPILTNSGLEIDLAQPSQNMPLLLNFFHPAGFSLGLAGALLVFLGIVILNEYLRVCHVRTTGQLSKFYGDNQRKRLFEVSINTRWDFYRTLNQETLQRLITRGVTDLERALSLSLEVIRDLIIVSVYTLVSGLISWQLTAYVCVISVIILIILKSLLGITWRQGLSAHEKLQKLSELMQNYLGGVRYIRASTHKKLIVNHFVQAVQKESSARLRYTISVANSYHLFQVGAAVIFCFILFFIIDFKKLGSADLIFFIIIFSRVATRLSYAINKCFSCVSLLPVAQEIKLLIDNAELNKFYDYKTTRPIELKHQIEFRNVSFQYPGQLCSSLLKDISLQIEVGKLTAIIGSSGSGKTTLLEILAGHIQPLKGEILIDQIALNQSQILEWQKLISYVDHEPFIFEDTVRNNLCMADSDCSDSELWQALDMLEASGFVRSLPLGLETKLGGQLKLSKGESQRLSIARALLQNTRVLLLDESTSALDLRTEEIVLKRIHELKKDMAIILVSHRPGVILEADVTYMLRSGRLRSVSVSSIMDLQDLIREED